MRSKVFWMAVWLVLGATALAQRTYLEAGTTANGHLHGQQRQHSAGDPRPVRGEHHHGGGVCVRLGPGLTW
jgi:hypothetical protein